MATLARERVASEHDAQRQLRDMFFKRYLGEKAVQACLDIWGDAAPALIRRNPFRMMAANIPGAGFIRCDRLYLEFGGRPEKLSRQARAGWYATRNCRSGSTWHLRGVFRSGIVETIGSARARHDDSLRLAKRARLIVERLDETGKAFIADPAQGRAEFCLASHVRRLLNAAGCEWPDVASPHVTVHQEEQLWRGRTSPLFLLTGTPGTGKTFVAAQLLRRVAEVHGLSSIAVCAPTGKAAVGITEQLHRNFLDLEATTIHRLLGVSRNGHDAKGWGFKHNRENQLPCKFLCVDEWSMCDTDLAHSLLSACRTGTHVLLVGDPNQLPPVGHGAPLRDFLLAGVPVAHLTEIHRNSGLITTSCERIVSGKAPLAVDRLDLERGHNLKMIECDTPQGQLDALRAVVEAMRKKPGIALKTDLQVLCALNDSSQVSRKPLNSLLQDLINPNVGGGTMQQVGELRLHDKIICLSNCAMESFTLFDDQFPYCVKSYTPDTGNLYGGGEPVFIANGDQGFVRAVDSGRGQLIATFQNPARTVKIVPKVKRVEEGDEEATGRASDFALAYAITGHKSQGSEWPYVIVLVDDAAGGVCSKEWVYTAISRGQRWVTLIGSRRTLEKQCKRSELATRKTFLAELIREGAGV